MNIIYFNLRQEVTSDLCLRSSGVWADPGAVSLCGLQPGLGALPGHQPGGVRGDIYISDNNGQN